jgi:uncharacterized protein with GYD domain
MPKYLIEASYTADGVKGVAAKGGTARREAVGELISSVGGNMESFHFAFGAADALVICELPGDEVAAALAMSINQSGTTTTRTVVLLTPEQVDSAAQAVPDYRAPGG